MIAGAPWGSVDGGAWLGRLQLLMGIFSGFLLPAVGLGWFVEYEEQYTSDDLFNYTMCAESVKLPHEEPVDPALMTYCMCWRCAGNMLKFPCLRSRYTSP